MKSLNSNILTAVLRPLLKSRFSFVVSYPSECIATITLTCIIQCIHSIPANNCNRCDIPRLKWCDIEINHTVMHFPFILFRTPVWMFWGCKRASLYTGSALDYWSTGRAICTRGMIHKKIVGCPRHSIPFSAESWPKTTFISFCFGMQYFVGISWWFESSCSEMSALCRCDRCYMLWFGVLDL